MLSKIDPEFREVHLIARNDEGDPLLDQTLAVVRGDAIPHVDDGTTPSGSHLLGVRAHGRRRLRVGCLVHHQKELPPEQVHPREPISSPQEGREPVRSVPCHEVGLDAERLVEVLRDLVLEGDDERS